MRIYAVLAIYALGLSFSYSVELLSAKSLDFIMCFLVGSLMNILLLTNWGFRGYLWIFHLSLISSSGSLFRKNVSIVTHNNSFVLRLWIVLYLCNCEHTVCSSSRSVYVVIVISNCAHVFSLPTHGSFSPTFVLTEQQHFYAFIWTVNDVMQCKSMSNTTL